MGCEIYIRKKNDSIQSFFLHNDRRGQYGSELDDMPILDKFIEGLVEIPFQENQKIIEKKCPLCRKKVESVIDIKGCSDKCSVCLTKNVEIFFVDCGHATTCKECYDKL